MMQVLNKKPGSLLPVWLLLLLLSSQAFAGTHNVCPLLYADLKVARQALLDRDEPRAYEAVLHARHLVVLSESSRGAELSSAESYGFTNETSVIREDLQSAIDSLLSGRPGHLSALEAVQSTLDYCLPKMGLHHDMVRAYADVVDAYVLISSPRFRPRQREQAVYYLQQARDLLQKAEADQSLIQLVQQQIDRHPPDAIAMRSLMDLLQLQIQRASS